MKQLRDMFRLNKLKSLEGGCKMPCKEKLKNPYKEPTLREWHENMKKMRENGLKPFLKGSRGRVKLEFE